MIKYACPPCAYCGKPDGGHSSSTSWGHDYSCCSEACGRAFRLATRLPGPR